MYYQNLLLGHLKLNLGQNVFFTHPRPLVLWNWAEIRFHHHANIVPHNPEEESIDFNARNIN